MNQLIVSSRVRLARNISDVPFKTQDPDAFDSIAVTLQQKNPDLKNVARIERLPQKMAQSLFERHLISRELLKNKTNGIIVAATEDKQNKVCVMFGEEDHIRIQVIRQGLNLTEAFATAKKLSADIERNHKIAHHKKLGYLTSCVTNLGTGMRASVMMFLPALTQTGYINQAVSELRARRITVRGVYGEGSEAAGFMYQISNQACLGLTEEQIIEMVANEVRWLAAAEFDMQARLAQADYDGILNKVMQAYGILTNSHMIASAQAVELLSWLKLGDCLGLVRFKPRVLDDLFFVTQPASVTHTIEQEDIRSRDKARAKKLADELLRGRIK